MSDQLSPLLLVGAGAMAQAYAKALRALGRPFVVAGRGRERAERFAAEWGVPAGHGDLAAQLAALPSPPREAVVAASAGALPQATRDLLAAGCRRLLIEKPAALDPEGAAALAEQVAAAGAEAYVAYNRRFYASTARAREMIAEDGGALSMKFDFTEATRRIEALNKDPVELSGWFFGNSTHVVDLAFFLAGEPVGLSAQTRGGLDWHPAGAVFTGHGRTAADVDFSYHADWLAPGRWGVEVMTRRRRLVLQPMERLFVQDHAGFDLKPEPLDDQADHDFKPGLLRQTEAFLAARPDVRLLPLADHARLFSIYAVLRDGGVYKRSEA